MDKKDEKAFFLTANYKKWRQMDYNISLDAEFEQYLAEVTGLQKAFITIWKAKRNPLTNEFDYYEFQYGNKYFALNKEQLTEITREDVFDEKKEKH